MKILNVVISFAKNRPQNQTKPKNLSNILCQVKGKQPKAKSQRHRAQPGLWGTAALRRTGFLPEPHLRAAAGSPTPIHPGSNDEDRKASLDGLCFAPLSRFVCFEADQPFEVNGDSRWG